MVVWSVSFFLVGVCTEAPVRLVVANKLKKKQKLHRTGLQFAPTKGVRKDCCEV